MATVIECSKISPPPDSPPEFSIPLLFFDMVWYDLGANQSVFFFELPCSKSHFLDTIVPGLKKSLSLTLSQFLPFAGNIIHPLNPAGDLRPILRYQSGDSVCFKVSESNNADDFKNLTGNHCRDCDEFYALAPQLPAATHSEDSVSCPVLALQVTVFPEQGFCISFATHHGVADASTVASFIQAWALTNRANMDDDASNISALLTEGNCLPFFDRKTVINLHGLDALFWDLIVKDSCSVEPPPVKLPINKERATFVLKKDEIQKLKNLILAKYPSVAHLSSFTVVCALVWVCSAKSAGPGGEEVADDEAEHFGFVADCRGRLKPPLPANYFGNCVAPIFTELKHGVVKGPDGFVMAALTIGEAITKNVYNEKGILSSAENWPEEYEKSIGARRYGVAGSPKFDFYAADYGLGKLKKVEALFIDADRSMFLCKSRDFEGGLEISLSKTTVQMGAFTRIFNEVLMDLLQ